MTRSHPGADQLADRALSDMTAALDAGDGEAYRRAADALATLRKAGATPARVEVVRFTVAVAQAKTRIGGRVYVDRG